MRIQLHFMIALTGLISRLIHGSAIATLAIASVGFGSENFDQMRAGMSKTMATQSEAAILELLKAGIGEGKPSQAIAEARIWMRQNVSEDPMVLYSAGRAAELSGDARGAVALYQQYLQKASRGSAGLELAVIAGHRINTEGLKDVSAAYAFNKANLDRFAYHPVVRQFDSWYLPEAIKRKDALAVTKRLCAVLESGLSEDHRILFYDTYFQWLIKALSALTESPGAISSSEELVAACKNLCKQMTFDKELALRIDWACSVRHYNKSWSGKKSGQSSQKPLKFSVAPPIAEAKALLSEYPKYAKWVQDGWAGGGRGVHYRGKFAEYWSHEVEAKFAPIVEVIPKLEPLDLALLMQSWQARYYNSAAVDPLELKVVKEFLRSNPQISKQRNGRFILGQAWNKISPEEAQKLAGSLVDSGVEEASVIRAIAAGGGAKDFNRMVAALLGPEAWRISHPDQFGRLVDQLWHYAGRPGGRGARDQKIQQASALAAKIKKSLAGMSDRGGQVTKEFEKIWQDYRSASPKIPAVFYRARTIGAGSADVVPILIDDSSVASRLLLHELMQNGISSNKPSWKQLEGASRVNISNYDPGIVYSAKRHGGGDFKELKKRRPKLYQPHPLEPVFRKLVSDSLARNSIVPWYIVAWVNMQYPEDNQEQIQLAKSLVQSPLWATLPSEAKFSLRRWFGKDVATPAQVELLQAVDPELIAKRLLAMVPPENLTKKNLKRKDTRSKENVDVSAQKADIERARRALSEVVKNLRSAPTRVQIPERSLTNLSILSVAVFDDAKCMELILELVDQLKAAPLAAGFGERLISLAAKSSDSLLLHRIAPYLWQYINRNHRSFPEMKLMMERKLGAYPSAVNALASAGLNAFKIHRGHSYFKREIDIPLFKALKGKAAMEMGLIVIPVSRGHVAYPVYSSQADWLVGNEDSAWDLVDAHWGPFMDIHRELSVRYIQWVLKRVIYSRNEERQKELIRALIGWTKEQGTPLTLQEQVEINIAYGDIALQRGQLREAHEIFARIEKNKGFKDVPMRFQAILRKAAAERIGKNFDQALQTLNELELERIPELWSDIRFARAEVSFDMGEYEDAIADINALFAREPNHQDGKILLGKVQLKQQKLIDSTVLDIGFSSKQKSIVPGLKLKVTLNDPTLAVSGAGSEIEVVVWADSGDRETFYLRQFGDQKTKFRGEIDTVLGPPSAADKVLQVLGDDKVYYAYSERFRKRMNDLPEHRGGPIIIASDAILMASARKLLTESEQRLADMERLIEELELKGTKNARQTARAQMASQSIEADARSGEGRDPNIDFQDHIDRVVKPGSQINVRVIDPDRSRSSGVDELLVSVASSSGDSISRVTLKETGTHTGYFEGSIATKGAQAMAFARNSEPGRNPNMVISPKRDYPAWRPTSKSTSKPDFTIDLNDNRSLGKMVITAKEEGAKLKKVLLQTAMNQKDWTTVASYPSSQMVVENPWHPSVTVLNDTDDFHANDNRKLVEQFNDVRQHLASGWSMQRFAQGLAVNVSGIEEAFAKSIPEPIEWKRKGRADVSHVIYRFKAHFYEPQNVTRKFRLNLGAFQIPLNRHRSLSQKPQFLLAVDGRRITGEGQKLEGQVNLKAGVHSFEIWATGWVRNIGFGRGCKLFVNLGDRNRLVECPPSFFDPEAFPDGVLSHRNGPARIQASSDGTRFDVDFAEGSRARLIRLVLADHEGPVPALNTISLEDSSGDRVLPVAEDFASLGKNDTLEILTGDKIFVRYLDDRFVSKNSERHERFLNVAYTNGRVEFADMEPRFVEHLGENVPFYEKLLRFGYNSPISIAVHDADMDVTVKPDKVKVKILSKAGGTKELIAMETGPSTGVFKTEVTPVAETTKADDQIQVGEGGFLSASYLDAENNRPGVPFTRKAKIMHVGFDKPKLFVGHSEARLRPVDKGVEDSRPTWVVESTLIDVEDPPEGGIILIQGRMAFLELKAPQMALRSSSEAEIFVQTAAGRARSNHAHTEGFNVEVPGTIRLRGSLEENWKGTEWNSLKNRDNRSAWESKNYSGGQVAWGVSNPVASDRFRFSMPLVADVLPIRGVLSVEQRAELRNSINSSRSASLILAQNGGGLVVRPGDKIFFGLKYLDRSGEEQWLQSSAKVVSHPILSLMDESYTKLVRSAYAGETIYLKVSDFGGDISDQIDEVEVLLQAKSGAKVRVQLNETGPHSGIFTGSYALSYVEEIEKLPEGYNVKRDGLPVTYGDSVAARYTSSNGLKTPISLVSISPGADGMVQPFSKQYGDEEIAMRTQFSLAEAYLEMAKRHRKLGETEAAIREYRQAKQLLAGAIEQFKDSDTRAHAEYLLGNLTLEEADTTNEAELKEDRYRAALSRFMTVTGNYSGTLFASKAQFKIATVYEKLNEPDIAAQEYVKLAYKYPESEFLALSMARLGSHFLKKASSYEKQAKPLLMKGTEQEDKDAMFEGEALQKMAESEYLKTAQIFGRMQQRFPNHSMAGAAGLRAGQAYMRARRVSDAIEAFNRVVGERSYDGKTLRAQAMYWVGKCYQDQRNEMAAYSSFKRLTYDFPESKWAAYARGQLSQGALLKLENKLELERLEQE